MPSSKWGERLKAYRETSERLDSYGHQRCGCTWDSGPYGVYCEKHDGEELERDLLAALVEMAERGERDDDLLAAAKSFLDDSESGSDRGRR